MNIGVLALQGGVIEHLKQIEALGHKGIEVKVAEDFEKIDAIIEILKNYYVGVLFTK